jgi:hypothetical protein
MSKDVPEKCYLCGQPLCAPTSVDHVPPKQLFAPAVRKTHKLQLLTIPVHAACNEAYQHDEDYFVHTLMPFAPGTYAGRAIYDEVLQKFRDGKKAGLTRRVLEEFEALMMPRATISRRANVRAPSPFSVKDSGICMSRSAAAGVTKATSSAPS